MPEAYTGAAVLRAAVSTALGALPLAGALVTVSTEPDASGERTLLYAVPTDENGMTPPLALAAPPRSASLTPNGGTPFAVYTVEAALDGYTPLTALRIAVFDGVSSVLPLALTPLPENTPLADPLLTARGAPQALDPNAPQEVS